MNSEEPRCRMLIYATNNIGDTIQAIAASRLFPQAVGIRRDSAEYDQATNLPMVVQGFLYKPLRDRLGDNCLFAGIYLCSEAPLERFLPWLQASPWPIGARDPWTADRLIKAGLKNVEMIGCPTLTLPRYDGPRQGHLVVDAERPGIKISHVGFKGASVMDQWGRAKALLGRYRTAELVTTNRLHVSLPCFAFGTAVRFIRHRIYETHRLSLLDHLGITDDEPMNLDVSKMAETYRAFLGRHWDMPEPSVDPKLPILGKGK